MIVCACEVVRAREIEAHVAAGARTVEDVGVVCGAGSHCGGCRAAIARIVAPERDREASAVAVAVGTATNSLR